MVVFQVPKGKALAYAQRSENSDAVTGPTILCEEKLLSVCYSSKCPVKIWYLPPIYTPQVLIYLVKVLLADPDGISGSFKERRLLTQWKVTLVTKNDSLL